MAQHDLDFSAVTTELITSYGITLKNLLQAYRVGGERIADFIGQGCLATAPLGPEWRRNTRVAQALVGSVYHRGLAVGAGGAEAVVDRLVEMANQSVLQAAANAARFDETLGLRTFAPLVEVTAPAAEAAALLANQAEAASSEWAQQMAGGEAAAAAPAVRRRSAFAKALARSPLNGPTRHAA